MTGLVEGNFMVEMKHEDTTGEHAGEMVVHDRWSLELERAKHVVGMMVARVA